MKKYVSIMAIMLCALIINVKAINPNNPKTSKITECECCKNCKDDKCKELCKQWSNMTAEAQKSEEGKKVKDECMKICAEKKCCSSTGKTTCEGMEGKGCCNKK
jgi:LAS superfamily LD-carboxypeptidase LdcB